MSEEEDLYKEAFRLHHEERMPSAARGVYELIISRFPDSEAAIRSQRQLKQIEPPPVRTEGDFVSKARDAAQNGDWAKALSLFSAGIDMKAGSPVDRYRAGKAAALLENLVKCQTLEDFVRETRGCSCGGEVAAVRREGPAGNLPYRGGEGNSLYFAVVCGDCASVTFLDAPVASKLRERTIQEWVAQLQRWL